MMYYHPVPVTITTHRRGFTNRPESLDGEMLHFEDQDRGCRFRSAMSRRMVSGLKSMDDPPDGSGGSPGWGTPAFFTPSRGGGLLYWSSYGTHVAKASQSAVEPALRAHTAT